MQIDRTTLADGRYLIYYTFDPALSPTSASADVPARAPEADKAENPGN